MRLGRPGGARRARSGEEAGRAGPRELAARALVLGLLGRVRDGALIVREGGRRHLCGRPSSGEAVPEVVVESPRTWRVVATEGAAGLGRAYVAGWWACATLDELTTLLRVVLRNLDSLERASALGRRLGSFTRRPVGRARRGGAERLEATLPGRLPDDALRLVLGEPPTGSSGVFSTPSASLADAQVEKFERVCRKLGLSAADHVAEVGAGWGGFALHAAARYGCRVSVAIPSPGRAEAATERAKRAGLDDLVTVVHGDPEALEGTFDHVVAIEAADDLGDGGPDAFLDRCSALLAHDGMLALQVVVARERHLRRARDDFLERYAWPRMRPPTLARLLEAFGRRDDLSLVALDDVGQHRAETLRHWRSAIEPHRLELERLGVDPPSRRLLEFSLCYREAGFAERRHTELQCFLAKPGWRPQALSRPAP